MSRNRIAANQKIFSELDRHCAARGQSLINAGKPRWIASDKAHRHFMTNARLSECVHFGPSRKLARLDLSNKSYLCSVGFERNQGIFRDRELDTDPAFLTVILSELLPRPSASLSEIREIVEWADGASDTEYAGHDHVQVESLFPKVRIYAMREIEYLATWNTFFRACIDECGFGSSWIEGRLADALKSMCELDQDRVPYRVLCRSIFDSDRSSFFLALYRCLEALYAYSSAQSLVKALKIETSWSAVATILEDKLGWHPREEGSLIRIVRFASRSDLATILETLRAEAAPENDELLISHAAKAIYGLRNSIVHYRPAQYKLDLDNFDWHAICEAMVGIVLDVYEAVFAREAA